VRSVDPTVAFSRSRSSQSLQRRAHVDAERLGVESAPRIESGQDCAQGVASFAQNVEVGTSGRTSGPNLHFEVRYDNHAYNPLSYLAPPGPSPIESFARNGPS